MKWCWLGIHRWVYFDEQQVTNFPDNQRIITWLSRCLDCGKADVVNIMLRHKP